MRKLRTLVRIACAAAGIALLAILGVYAWMRFAPRDVPAGQPPLATLDSDSIGAVREAFDAWPDEVRVLALLSPT